jgi:hypothetical protein
MLIDYSGRFTLNLGEALIKGTLIMIFFSLIFRDPV